MASDNFYQGYMNQSMANANQEVRRANIKIAELRDLRREDAATIAQLEEELQKANTRLRDAKRIIDVWNAHYVALEAQAAWMLELLDKVFGRDKNPARKLAYADDVPDRIPTGKREGERVTMRDHIYFARLAELTKGPLKHLGNWKELLRTAKYFE